MNVINDPTINKIAKEILQNDQFREDCKKNITEILKDGKLDTDDTPFIISLVVDIYNNYSEFEVDEKKLGGVFKIIIMSLLGEMDLLTADNKDIIDKLVSSSLKLLFTQVKQRKLMKKFCKFMSKLFTCKCCKCCK